MRAQATTTSIYTSIKGAAKRIDVSDFTIRDLINLARRRGPRDAG